MDDEIQINIKMTSTAQVYKIKILKSDTIQTLKEKCEKETSIPAQSQNMVYKGRILSNEKLISDYKIENDHTIILVKKHTASQPSTTENKTTSQNTTSNNTNNNTSSNNNTNNNNNNNNTNNNSNNNQNPFMGMGGQMPDLSQLGSLMGNIDPSMLSSMMQNLGNGGGFGNLGMNPQMLGQLFNNPMYMQMMQSMLQNPEMLQMAINSPQMRQLAQNNPQMQAILNNPQLLQQMLNPQTLQMMSNMFQSMSGNNNSPNNNNNNNNGGQMPPFDFSQMANMFGNMGGLFGNQNNNNGVNSGSGNGENFSNVGINDNNDPNVDYKEKYKDQLAQMKEMGFVNEETNIQVLKQCSGNVQFAIERLLNMLG